MTVTFACHSPAGSTCRYMHDIREQLIAHLQEAQFLRDDAPVQRHELERCFEMNDPLKLIRLVTDLLSDSSFSSAIDARYILDELVRLQNAEVAAARP